MKIFIQIVGWTGAVLLILAYLLISCDYVKSDNALYQFLNLFGAMSMGINVFHQQAWPAFAIQIIWALIAIITLMRPV